MERAWGRHFTLLIVAVVSTLQIQAAPNCDLKEIFETPKQLHDYDKLEIRERSCFNEDLNPEFRPIITNPTAQESPKSFANAQVLLKFGNDGQKTHNVLNSPQILPYPILTPPSTNPHCLYPSFNPLTHFINPSSVLEQYAQLSKLGLLNIPQPIKKPCPEFAPLTNQQKLNIKNEILSEVKNSGFTVQNSHPEILPDVQITNEEPSVSEEIVFVPTAEFGKKNLERTKTIDLIRQASVPVISKKNCDAAKVKYVLKYPVIIDGVQETLAPIEVQDLEFTENCGCSKSGPKKFNFDVDDLNKRLDEELVFSVVEQHNSTQKGDNKPKIFGYEIHQQSNIANGIPSESASFTLLTPNGHIHKEFAPQHCGCPHCLTYKEKLDKLVKELNILKSDYINDIKQLPPCPCRKPSDLLSQDPIFVSNYPLSHAELFKSLVSAGPNGPKNFSIVKQSGCPHCAKYKEELNQY